MLIAFLLCPLATLSALVALLCLLPYLAARLVCGSVDGAVQAPQSWEELELELDVAAGWDVLLAVRPCKPRRQARGRKARLITVTLWHAARAELEGTRASVRNCWAGKGCSTTGPP